MRLNFAISIDFRGILSILLAFLTMLSLTACGGGGGGAEATGSGNSITLAWDPPTTNEDGTTLTDLAGFMVHYGTSTGTYLESADVGNATTYTLPGLPEGTYYVAVTAYNTLGNESGYSNEVSKTITP